VVRKRAPWGAVLRDLPPEEMVPEVDWSLWYLDEDDMVESWEQGAIIRTLLSSLEELARLKAWRKVLFGADNYFAWLPDEPRVRVSPDVYLVDDPPEPPIPAGWQTWLPGHHPPRWAVEIVSSDWKKDYEEAPAKYAQLGCRELILFDPDVARAAVSGKSRVALTAYRRGQDGLFVQTYSGTGPVFSAELDAWLGVRLEGPVARLRFFLDEACKQLVPTEGEARAVAEQRVRELEEKLRKLEAAKP
jgi:Uma2 family endonuclease